ncbi:hypothetical protein B0H63DRAFT_134282 [Podospora didyma]|uniref:Uncharacterized protein n=1 Tax=Podospora didyma TaxID=330526 RepID=A0AAE0U4Z2_9PEZI|nr:hypothetical protein B0H63DRAFT_134282 [Podospora didyma]
MVGEFSAMIYTRDAGYLTIARYGLGTATVGGSRLGVQVQRGSLTAWLTCHNCNSTPSTTVSQWPHPTTSVGEEVFTEKHRHAPSTCHSAGLQFIGEVLQLMVTMSAYNESSLVNPPLPDPFPKDCDSIPATCALLLAAVTTSAAIPDDSTTGANTTYGRTVFGEIRSSLETRHPFVGSRIWERQGKGGPDGRDEGRGSHVCRHGILIFNQDRSLTRCEMIQGIQPDSPKPCTRDLQGSVGD